MFNSCVPWLGLKLRGAKVKGGKKKKKGAG